jgi:hypothetical protein
MSDHPKDAPPPAGGRGAGGHPRRIRTSAQDRGHDHPAVVSAVPEDQALPGELRPLTYQEGRQEPVTAEEALGVMIRRHRTDQVNGRTRGETPTALPASDESKAGVLQRLPPLLMAFVRARAEIEGTNPTAVTEETLIRYALGVPQAPHVVKARQREILEWFIHEFPPKGPAESPDRVPVPGLVPAWLLAQLNAAAQRQGLDPADLLTEILARGLELT